MILSSSPAPDVTAVVRANGLYHQSMTIARRFIVRGRVQGVGFRYFAIRAARQAGVVGSVRNLADGTVEAIAEGPREAITEFGRALEQGPSYAHVTQIDEIEMQPTGRYTGFDAAS